MNLASLLEERAWLHPERLALVDARGTVSYGELARRVSAGAGKLQELGLERGQVVLVFQPVSITLYEILLAAFHAGLRVMLADPSAGREFLSHCCKRLMPDAFFGSWKAQCLRLTVAEMRGIETSICSGGWFPGASGWRSDGVGVSPVEVADEEAALVTFTSGSTGVPKAAVRSHGFLLAQHRALSKALDFEDGEVDLITLPVFVLANLASGLTSVLAATDLARPGAPDLAAVRAQCAGFKVTRCAASPAFFEALLEGMPPFRKIYTGGAPVFPDLLRRLQKALPAAEIQSVYGSTEAEPIAHLSAGEVGEEILSITRSGGGLCSGVPVAEVELRVISDHWGKVLGPLADDEFGGLVIPNGEAGEIIVSGNHVLNGYLGGIGDEETKIHVADRIWHRTGDAGWLDAEGRVWLLGRAAERLPAFCSPVGLPVDAFSYPFAIECALREEFPSIRVAAMNWLGKRTLIVGEESNDERRAAIQRAAGRFGMEEVIHLKSLPMDRRHQAKIDYPALRETLRKLSGVRPPPP